LQILKVFSFEIPLCSSLLGRNVGELKLVLDPAAIRNMLLQLPNPLQLAPDEGGALLPLVLQNLDGPVEHSPRPSILSPYLTATVRSQK
jgi:hypothetical protein